MGRHRTNIPSIGETGDPGWRTMYRIEWGQVVGGRVRRLREAQGLALHELAARVRRPDGGHYSTGFLSRLERGWASPPLWVYVTMARLFEVHPGRLLGLDDAEKQLSDAELTLVRLLRRRGMEPEEAIERMLGPGGSAGAAGTGDPYE